MRKLFVSCACSLLPGVSPGKHYFETILVRLAIVCFLFPEFLYAYHIAALNISYRPVGLNQYYVTVRLYRDCRKDQNPVTTDIDLQYLSVTCGLQGQIKLPLVTGDRSGLPGTGIFISLPCLGVTSCDTSQYSVEEFSYEDTLFLPAVCTDWVISHQTPGQRNYNNILVDPTTQYLYISALINNADAPQNNSPVFEKPSVAIFCVNFEYYFNQGATDADGDSLVYVLSPAQGENGDVIPYDQSVYPYSYTDPVQDPAFALDPVNGIIHFTPPLQMISVFCITIYEYRNGILIGSIKTDMQAVISASFNCSADTLAFMGDTTTPTGPAPARSDTCLTQSIAVWFNSQIKCESISDDTSEFVLINAQGDTVLIDSLGYVCDINGSTDIIVLYLHDPLAVVMNGSYWLTGLKGNDGDPLLSACDRPLVKNMLEIRVRDCPVAWVNLKNVSVENNEKIKVHWETTTLNFPDTFFIRYDICRSPVPVNYCDFSAGSVTNLADTVFYDASVDVSSQVYNYAVKLYQKISLLDTVSDSIQSILLAIDPALTDTANLFLSWTPYWGWQNPKYFIMERTGSDGPWKTIDSTYGLTYQRVKPELANDYWIKIQSRHYLSRLTTESNWVSYKVNIWHIPNVITPNNDGINDRFFVNETELRGKTHLSVINRWGFRVFEDENYNNNWRGTKWNGMDLPEGTYFYVLRFADGTSKSGYVLILK